MRLEDFITDIPTSENGVQHRQYDIWRNMIKKCYMESYRDYKWRGARGYTVSKEWQLYSSFKKWYDENYVEGCIIDSSLSGKKYYGPDSCVFVKRAERKEISSEEIEDALRGVESEYELFESFFRANTSLIIRTAAYYGLSFDELKQECAIVFFENRRVMYLFLEGKQFAFYEFQKHLIKSLKDFSQMGMQIKENEDYEREKVAMEKIFSSTDEATTIEDNIMSNLEIDRLCSIYGRDEIESILEYYDVGYELFAAKRGISGDVARKRISRLLSKIKKREGESSLHFISRKK